MCTERCRGLSHPAAICRFRVKDWRKLGKRYSEKCEKSGDSAQARANSVPVKEHEDGQPSTSPHSTEQDHKLD